MKPQILLIGMFEPVWAKQLAGLGTVVRTREDQALQLLGERVFAMVFVSGRPACLPKLKDLYPNLIRIPEQESDQALFLRSILDNLPHMVFVKDARDLRFVRWNKAGEQLVGISREEMVGKTDYDLFPADEAAFFQRKDREVLAQRVLHDIPEETLNTRHGVRILHTKKIPICNDDGEPLYLLGISEDITELKKMKAEAAARLEAAREAERRHIARELHDELGQLLTALKLDLGRLESQLDPSLLAQVESMSGLLDHTIKTVRRLSTELRPQILDDLGLHAALEWLVEQASARKDLSHDFRWEVGDLKFNEVACSSLFRICQEALNNVLRHSKANHVQVEFRCDQDSLHLSVEDDGVGLPERPGEKKGLGLLGIRERVGFLGGSLEIKRAASGGTHLQVSAPLSGCLS